jgi:hypothetical protein
MTKPDNPRATRAPKKRRDWKPAWLAAFEELGTERLKPVYEQLEEQVPFTTLRLVRCAMMAEG